MKIEKISDTQIRCTLSSDELASRELKLTELSYGSDKAKSLFQDMLQRANFELGFDASNVPLMIEAIPMGSKGIVVLVTKVENADELDTRFSRFTPAPLDDDVTEIEDSSFLPNAFDEVKNLFKKKGLQPLSEQSVENKPEEKKGPYIAVFAFKTLGELIEAARVCTPFLGKCSLYKKEDDHEHPFYCILEGKDLTKEGFLKTCNTLSEYGSNVRFSYNSLDYFKDRNTCLIEDNALDLLK